MEQRPALTHPEVSRLPFRKGFCFKCSYGTGNEILNNLLITRNIYKCMMLRTHCQQHNLRKGMLKGCAHTTHRSPQKVPHQHWKSDQALLQKYIVRVTETRSPLPQHLASYPQLANSSLWPVRVHTAFLSRACLQ